MHVMCREPVDEGSGGRDGGVGCRNEGLPRCPSFRPTRQAEPSVTRRARREAEAVSVMTVSPL